MLRCGNASMLILIFFPDFDFFIFGFFGFLVFFAFWLFVFFWVFLLLASCPSLVFRPLAFCLSL